MRHFSLLLLFGFLSVASIAQVVNADTLKNQGNDAIRNEKYKDAFNYYSQALTMLQQEGKTDTTLIYNTAYCAFKSQLWNDALPLFEKSIELSYKEEKPYQFVAQIYGKQDDYEKMEKSLLEGINKYPQDKTLKKLLSNCYLKQGLVFYKEGNTIKKKANDSGLNTSNPDAFKAEYEKANEQFRLAAPLFEKAIEFDKKNDNAFKALENIYTTLELTEELEKLKTKL